MDGTTPPPRRARRLAAWLPAVVLVPTALVVAAVAARPVDAQAGSRDLYPLDVGSTWVYAVSDHGQPSGTHTRQVLDHGLQVRRPGALRTVARVRDTYTDYPGTGPRTTETYLDPAGDRIQELGLSSVDHQYRSFEPAATIYPRLTHVGDDYRYAGTLDSRTFPFSVELTDRGDVSVGGRTFTGCSQFTTTVPVAQADGSSADDVIVEWTCPDVGPVRSQDTYAAGNLSITEELTALHGPAGDWSAAGSDDGPGPLAAKADTALGVLGFDPARTYAVPGGVLGRRPAWTTVRSVAGRLPPVGSGDLMVDTDRRGVVTATYVATGEEVWQVGLEAPILVTPAISGDVVLVADAGKRLRALSLADGSTRWQRELDDVVTVSPAPTDDAVAVATDDGRLSVLSLADGSVLWRTRLGGPATTVPAVVDGIVYVCDGGGGLSAYDLADGHQRWSRSLAGGVQLGPTVAGGRVLAQSDDGVISSFAADDGTLQWQSRTRGYWSTGTLSVSGDTVLALLDGDRLYGLDLADGRRRWRRSVPHTEAAPVSVGAQLLTVSVAGQVRVLDAASGRTDDTWTLPSPQAGTGHQVDVSPGLVGTSVVLTDAPGRGLAPLTHYAYPVAATAPDDGVLLGLRAHPVPSPLAEPATTTADGGLLVPGFDGSLTRVAGGAATPLARTPGRVGTAGVAARGLVVTRQGDQLVAVPERGGPTVWSVPDGTSYAGSAPVLSGPRVVAGTADGRLLSLALATGRVLWSAPVAADYLPSTPALLPGGDVVYGVGLARYDARTGAVRWQHPDVVTYGAPVATADAVYTVVARSGQPSGVGAWDARTGAPLWFVPGTPASYLGPSVAGALLTWADAYGVVHALDAADGTERWSLDLHRPAGGVPVVDGDLVLVTALGRPEVAEQEDYRVLALRADTGRFVGSWEPPTTASWIVPFVGPAATGGVLAPTTTDGGYVVVEVTPGG